MKMHVFRPGQTVGSRRPPSEIGERIHHACACCLADRVQYAGIGQLEGHTLQPLIMGHQVSLHPLVVALGVAAGTLTAGILGAVIATPLISVIWTVFTELHDFDPPIEGPLPPSARRRQ